MLHSGALKQIILLKGYKTMFDDYLFADEEILAQFEDSLDEKGNSKRDKIISVISNFDFDRFRSASEWISLYIDDYDYPVFKKKINSVEVSLIYTSDTGGILKDKNFTLEVFVYGRTIITCLGKAPSLAFLIAKAISADFLEAIRPAYNLKEKKSKRTRRFKKAGYQSEIA
jgi:hypothetical protein